MENIRKLCYFFFQTGPPTARYGKNLGQAKKRYKEEKKILTFRLTRDHLRHLFALIKCLLHCMKEIGDFQIICSKVGGFRPFNYLLGVTCYLLSLKCKWLVLNKLCNFTAYKLFVSTNKQLSDPMDSMADPLFSSYSVCWGWLKQTLVLRPKKHILFRFKNWYFTITYSSQKSL